MKAIFALVLLSVFVVACAPSARQSAPQSSVSAQPGAIDGGALAAMRVEAALAREETLVDAIIATGQIEAMQSIELCPEIDGRIVEIYAREGAEVIQGTPLFKIDDAELKAQVAQAVAQRDLAQQALLRSRTLVAKSALSQAELERVEAAARSAEAQLMLLEVRLARTTVRAPFTGVIGQRFTSLGDYVTTTRRLVAVQTVSPMRASFWVAERYADRLRVGQLARFSVSAFPDKQFTAVVDFVDPIVQLPGRTINVKARVENPKRELRAGMFIEAHLTTRLRQHAVLIPEEAVLRIEGAPFVWVAQNGKATRRGIDLGDRMMGFVEAKRGVKAGEQVVVGGQERLAEGMPIRLELINRTQLIAGESL